MPTTRPRCVGNVRYSRRSGSSRGANASQPGVPSADPEGRRPLRMGGSGRAGRWAEDGRVSAELIVRHRLRLVCNHGTERQACEFGTFCALTDTTCSQFKSA